MADEIESSDDLDPAKAFRRNLTTFNEELLALLDLATHIASETAKLDEPTNVLGPFRAAFLSMPQEDKPRYLELAIPFREAMDAQHANPDDPDLKAKSDASFYKMLDEIAVEFVDRQWARSTLSTVARAVARKPRLPILMRSLLASLVSNFEMSLGRVVEIFYGARPQTLQGAQFDLHDLAELGSIADARELAIQRRVDSWLRDSLDDWISWFSQNLQINLENCASDMAAVREVILRRHVVVHNDSRVSAQYLAGIKAGPETPTIGEHLPVDSEYFSDALDHLAIVGFRLNYSAWHKLRPGDTEAILKAMNVQAYQFMFSDRWNLVLAISDSVKLWSKSEDDVFQISRCNSLLARKNIAGVESIRAETEAWNVEPLSLRYRLAKAALIDDYDKVFELMPLALAALDVMRPDMYEWPLLASVREDPRFSRLVADAVTDLTGEVQPDLGVAQPQAIDSDELVPDPNQGIDDA